MVFCTLSSIMMAPLVPRIVLMKNSWKPLVAACVTMNSPTPRMMHDRLISIARFFAVRKRSAMRKFWDIRAPYFFFEIASDGSSSTLTLSPARKLSRSSTITFSPGSRPSRISTPVSQT